MSETGKRLPSANLSDIGGNFMEVRSPFDVIVHAADAEEAAALNPRGWVEAPRARDLPAWRAVSEQCWEPHGPFTLSARVIATSSREHAHDFKPAWERATMRDSQLWFVGAPMCDLLVGAAPAMPPLKLTASVLPDEAGFVFFEAPLAGIDADGTENQVTVGAYLWGRAVWEHPRTLKQRPVIGITVYGPGIMPKSFTDVRSTVPLMPLGGLVWPFGETCDVQWFDGDARDQSMSEDRRRLLALWLLSTQPGLASNHLHEVPVRRSKAKRKRIAAGKVQEPESPVRVIQLRRQPPGDHDAPERAAGARTYRHRWTVSGHWRNQAFGPERSLRRPTYINPYLKGPDDAPLLKSERVKAWTK